MKKIENIAGIAGIVLLITSLIWYSISNLWQTVHWILLILGAAGIAYFLFVFFSAREKVISKRSLKYGSNVGLQVLIVLAIVAMLAFVFSRQHLRWDLTANNLYSLSEQTEKILNSLDKDVEIKAFYKSADQSRARDLLDEYEYRSPYLRYDLIDPDEKPQITKRYGVTKYNTVVVESGVKRETINQLNESNLTNAIIKVTREQDKVVYFLTGHGERSMKDDSPQGYKVAAEEIRKDNHLTKELYLARRGSIPDSCTVLAILSPKTDLFQAELDTIEQWVKDGGKLLVTMDPELKTNLREFLQKFHIDVGNDMVIEQSFAAQIFGGGPGIPLVNYYDPDHAITKGFQVMTFFPYASSVTPMEDKGGYNMTELLKTSKSSWAENDFSTGEVSFDPSQDRRGPITLAVIAEKTLPKGKSSVLVFGDGDFASNAYFKQQGNGNLFMNAVNYLAEEEDLISVRPKQIDDRRLTLTQADVSGLFYLVVIAIPLIVIVLGVVIFFKRNRA